MTSQLLWILLFIQVAMGAFDTLYHHELTERLAWRPSQGHELRAARRAQPALRRVLFSRSAGASCTASGRCCCWPC